MENTLTVAVFDTAGVDILKSAVKAAWDKSGETAKLDFVSFNCYKPQLKQDVPDVFVLDIVTLGSWVDQIEQLSETDLGGAADDFFSVGLDATRVDGEQDKYYGVPQLICSEATAYADLKATAPSSITGLVETSNELAFPIHSPTNAACFYLRFCYGTTGTIPDVNSKEWNDQVLAAMRAVVTKSGANDVREFFRLVSEGKIEEAAKTTAVAYSEVAASAQPNADKLVQYLINQNVVDSISNDRDHLFYVDAICVNKAASQRGLGDAAKKLAALIGSEAVLREYTDQQRLLTARKALMQGRPNANLIDGVKAKPFRLPVSTTMEQVNALGVSVLQRVQHEAIATIRCLAADIVGKANSGHPGMPMGMAPVAYVLWKHFLRVSPQNPQWANRDRWVLSNGHGSALQYSMLHLCGFDLSMDDLQQFRQLGSKTPGHPEHGVTVGVEATTGPLGQGIANAVGMAMAEKHMRSAFNNDGEQELVGHNIFVFCGDGCLMEGIGLEAVSIAGHFKLSNLVLIYDDNSITIDGSTNLTFSQNMEATLSACGWYTQTVRRGDTDLVAMREAIANARAEQDRPSLICLKTTIGFSSKLQGTAGAHGAPLKAEDLALVKQAAGLPSDKSFYVPERTLAEMRAIGTKGDEAYQQWLASWETYKAAHAEQAAHFESVYINKGLPPGTPSIEEICNLIRWNPTDKADATRNLSGQILNKLAPIIPTMIGGSADLTPSTKTSLQCSGDFAHPTYSGRYIRFGVREHAMAALGNGLALHGMVPFVATFLNFIGYALGAVRVGALTHLGVIYIATHDSIGLGEDGPTHQPVEILPLLRAIPNLLTMRPADGNEVAAMYAAAIHNRKRPSVLALSRQNTPHLEGSTAEKALKGGYVLQEPSTAPTVLLVGTGTEVAICVEAAGLLAKDGVHARVVSMPCWELFDDQSKDYQQEVFSVDNKPVWTFSVEASSTVGWERFSHFCLGMTTFGESAPYEAIYDKLGLTGVKIAERVKEKVSTVSGVAAPLLPCFYR